MNLCEEPRWDSTRATRCVSVGFRYCVLHKEKLKENKEGWRICCASCITPFHKEDIK